MRPSFAEVPAAAARANSGAAEEGAPASSDSDPARSDASASFPGSAEERRSGPDGPRAWGVADCRLSPNRALGAGPRLNRRAVFSDASPAQRSPPERPLGGPGGAQGLVLRRLAWGLGGPSNSCPIRQAYRTSPPHDKRGGIVATQRDKPPRKIHHAPVIRADLKLLADPPPDREDGVPAPPREARASQDKSSENPGTARLSAAGADPGLGAGERKGRGGRSPVCRRRRARASRRLSCAPTRPPPGRCAPASRCRAPRPRAKILRLNADEAALRDLRFAVGDPLGPAANLLSLWRDVAGRPPSLDPGRIVDAAARLDLAVDPNGLAASLKACAGEGDPVSAAAKAAGPGVLRLPGRPSGRSRNPCRFGCSTWSSPSGCAGRGPCR